MSSATLTLIGLWNYDHDLFNNFTLPEGLDKDTAINTIIMRGGDYEVMYPDTDLLKDLIGTWSTQKEFVITQWLRAMTDLGIVAPLENYDRLENWRDEGTSHDETTDNVTDTSRDTLNASNSSTMAGTGSTSGQDTSSGQGSVTDVGQISADDVDTFVNKDKSSQTNNTSTSASTSTSSQTNTTNNGSSESLATGSKTSNATGEKDGETLNVHSGRIHGNIGVLTSAAMYSEWVRMVRDYGDIYELIATMFLQDFTIPIL